MNVGSAAVRSLRRFWVQVFLGRWMTVARNDLGSSLVVKFPAQSHSISQINQWMEDIYCTKAAAERE